MHPAVDPSPTIRHDAAPVAGRWDALRKAVSGYRNDDVVSGFLGSFDVSREEAELIFAETLKWLWFGAYARAVRGVAQVGIDEPILIIDEMWHAFILHTRDYAAFCERHFGHYVHHQPSGPRDAAALRAELDAVPDARRREWWRQRKRQDYALVYDALGRDTFVTWYLDFPNRYPPATIRRLRK